MDAPKKSLIVKGGEVVDHPGWYKIDGRIGDQTESFSMIRKPDGTWWWVAVTHIFPPEGGTVRFDLGEQITEPNTITQCEEYYDELLRKLDEKKAEESPRKLR
jgi:hypothetical protein